MDQIENLSGKNIESHNIEGEALKVCFLTLGCKVNQTESEALAQVLAGEGYQVVQETVNPDVIIVNTCTVTSTGSSKSRKLIRKIAKEHPQSTLVVMGCYSQTRPEEVAGIAGVDLVMGTQDRLSVLEHLANLQRPNASIIDQARSTQPIRRVKRFAERAVYEELPPVANESRSRAMLKIQDGCSQFCTYCIVPYARGPSRSRNPQNVLAEAKQLLAAGYQEIVLTGIHIGAYGKDLQEEIDLAELLSRLLELDGMKRLRLGSVEPMEFNTNLLDIITTSGEICPHFHIPLQSGSNAILERMKRPYSTQDYALLLKQIRKRLPDAAIAADIMTGFPGETAGHHQEALDFIESCNFAGIHAFPFSRREGTPAAAMPDQVPKSIKAARTRDLIRLGQISRQRYAEKFAGRTVEVLLERVDTEGNARGHSRNYLELKLPAVLNPGSWQPGDLVTCTFSLDFLL